MVIFVAVVSITLLIGLFGTRLPGFSKDIYCQTFFHIYSSTFIPEKVRVDQSYCKQGPVMGITRLTKGVDYVTSFSDGSSSKRVSSGTIYIDLPAKKVVSAYLSVSVSDDVIHTIEVDIGNNGVDFGLELNSTGSPNVLNITNITNDYLADSPQQPPIRVPISVSGGSVVVHDLSVEYEGCFVKEEILAGVMACWQLADHGKSSKDIICSEIVVPQDLTDCTQVVVSERNITELLVEEELCNVLSNNDAGIDCGDENNLEWNIGNLSNLFDISIEYQARKRKIIVS